MKKQLIDIYKQDKEANEFIQKHLAEFPEESYNDLTALHPHIIKVRDVSVIIQNVHLLKSKKNKAIITDYFNGMSAEDLTKKYKYKNVEVIHDKIPVLKNIIKKRFKKLLDEQLKLELKKVDKNELSNKIKDITFNLTRNEVNVILVKVKFKNKLNYKLFDEDVSVLYKKAKLIVNNISKLEQTTVNKILTKYPNPDDLKKNFFNQLKDIMDKYRWVNSQGYFLPKVLDDAITQILSFNETELPKKDQYFQ